MRSKNFLLVLILATATLAACGDVDSSAPTEEAVDEQIDTSVDEDLAVEDDKVGEETTDDEELTPASVFGHGPYNIGHRRWEITYDAVGEPDRTIKLSVWYPTEDEDGEPGRYLVNFQRHEVIADASVAVEEQAPLLVFSHGNSSLAEQSYFMTEFFASHGWIVVAPYHTGNTVFDDLDGISFESASVRPQDITATLDAMYGLDSTDPLAGKISDEVVMSGHSFGGFTTLAVTGAEFAVDEIVETCSENDAPRECSFIDTDASLDLFRDGFLDDRIDVAIPQAPGGFFVYLDGISAVEIPTLLFTGALDATLPEEEEGDRIWAAMTGPHMRVDLRTGGHFTFSNMCDLLPGLETVADDGCGEGFIAPEYAYELINAYSLAFVRRTLWGDTTNDDLLTGVDNRYQADTKLSWKPGSDIN